MCIRDRDHTYSKKPKREAGDDDLDEVPERHEKIMYKASWRPWASLGIRQEFLLCRGNNGGLFATPQHLKVEEDATKTKTKPFLGVSVREHS